MKLLTTRDGISVPKQKYLTINNGTLVFKRPVPAELRPFVGKGYIQVQAPRHLNARGIQEWYAQVYADAANKIAKAKRLWSEQAPAQKRLAELVAVPNLPVAFSPLLSLMGPIDGLEDARKAILVPDGPITPDSLRQRIAELTDFEKGIKLTLAKLEAEVIDRTGDTTADDPVFSGMASAMKDGLQADRRALEALASGVNAIPLPEEFQQMQDHWKAQNVPTEKTYQECGYSLQLLLSYLGPDVVSVSAITRDRIRGFLSHLQSMQKPNGKFYALASLQKHRNLLAAVFKAWFDADKIELNPFAGANFSSALRKKNAPQTRDDFSSAQLLQLEAHSKALISSSIEREQTRGWVLLLAISTGARLSDIALIPSSNVVERDGLWCLHVVKGKTAQTRRYLPVPKVALEAGFVAFYERNKARKYLFDYAAFHKGDIARLSQTLSTSLNRILTGLGIKTGPGLVFHSARHTTKTSLRRVTPDTELRDRVQGHAIKGAAGGYGEIEVRQMREALDAAYEAATGKRDAPQSV